MKKSKAGGLPSEAHSLGRGTQSINFQSETVDTRLSKGVLHQRRDLVFGLPVDLFGATHWDLLLLLLSHGPEGFYINKIENSLGEILKNKRLDEYFSEKNEALIYIVRDMMKDVINSGTGRALKSRYKFNNPVAGKTGTTNSFTDAWFVGFTPELAIGVWVGMDNPAVSINKYGSQAALPIFAKSIKKIYDFGEYSLGEGKVRKLNNKLDWEEPSTGLVKKRICKESMKPANKYCKQRSELLDELFLDNFVPQKCDIDSHSSLYK